MAEMSVLKQLELVGEGLKEWRSMIPAYLVPMLLGVVLNILVLGVAFVLAYLLIASLLGGTALGTLSGGSALQTIVGIISQLGVVIILIGIFTLLAIVYVSSWTHATYFTQALNFYKTRKFLPSLETFMKNFRSPFTTRLFVSLLVWGAVYVGIMVFSFLAILSNLDSYSSPPPWAEAFYWLFSLVSTIFFIAIPPAAYRGKNLTEAVFGALSILSSHLSYVVKAGIVFFVLSIAIGYAIALVFALSALLFCVGALIIGLPVAVAGITAMVHMENMFMVPLALSKP